MLGNIFNIGLFNNSFGQNYGTFMPRLFNFPNFFMPSLFMNTTYPTLYTPRYDFNPLLAEIPYVSSTPQKEAKSTTDISNEVKTTTKTIVKKTKNVVNSVVKTAKKVCKTVKNTVKTAGKKISNAINKGLTKAFLNKVKQIAKRVNCDYKDLLAVMNAESGLNSKAVNKHGGATGLIQFMPQTAKGLGVTTEYLKNLSAIDQLDYVEKFIKRAKTSAGFSSGEKISGGQLYALIFLPARAKREVLTSKGEKYYKSNSRTDINGDGKITKSELDQRINNFRVDESIFNT